MHPKMFLKNSVADPNTSKSIEHNFRCVCMNLHSYTMRIASNCLTFLTTCVVHGCLSVISCTILEDWSHSSIHLHINYSSTSFFPSQFRFVFFQVVPLLAPDTFAPSTVTCSRAAPLLPRPRKHDGQSCAYGMIILKNGNWLRTKTSTSHSTKPSSHRFSSH